LHRNISSFIVWEYITKKGDSILNNKTTNPMDHSEPYIGMPIYMDEIDEMSELDKITVAAEDIFDGNYQYSANFENWPLAMAYVPMQKWGDVYEPAEALRNATIFPELNLPFLGGGWK